VGDDDLLYHAMRFRNGAWTGFLQLDGAGGYPNFAARDVAIAITGTWNSPGSAHVVANGLAAGGLFHRVRAGDGTWTPFGGVPGANGRDTKEVAIAITDNGDAYTAVTQRNGSGFQVLRQVRWSNGSWDSFVPVGGVPANVSDVALSVTTDSSPKARVAFTDADGATWYQERSNISLPSAWTGAATNTQLMSTGSRTVSMTEQRLEAGVTSVDVLVTQAQPQ